MSEEERQELVKFGMKHFGMTDPVAHAYVKIAEEYKTQWEKKLETNGKTEIKNATHAETSQK